MRTFQFSDAKSHKFWNIDVQGNSFTVTYGKIGAAGQTQTKTFKDAAAAQTEADKLIKEKTKKGYHETTPKASVSDEEAFITALQKNPHDLAGWCAFADLLAEKGDPRGEFMQVQIALEDESRPKKERDQLKKQEEALLKAHEREWLGPLAEVTIDAKPVDGWVNGTRTTRAPVGHAFARGWLSRLEFHELSVKEARTLAQSPGASLLRELVVEALLSESPIGTQEEYVTSFYEPGPDVPADVDSWSGPSIHALCRCPQLATVRVLQLGEGTQRPEWTHREVDHNCHMSGEFAFHLAKQMPGIEELHLFAHRVDANKLFVLPMPNLRILQLYHSHSYPLDKLAANKTLTEFTTLRCHPHAMEYDDEEGGAYIRLAHLRAICQAPQFQKLTALCLRLTDFGDKGADEIVSSGILKRLKMLDLQGGCISDTGAKALAACPDLKNLQLLNLRANALTDEGAKVIQATGVHADVSVQHEISSGEFSDGELPEYLFDGDIE